MWRYELFRSFTAASFSSLTSVCYSLLFVLFMLTIFFKGGLSVFEFGGFMNLMWYFFFVCFCFLFLFVFVYFAQEERNQMLRIRSHLVDMVLTREMQYTCMWVRKSCLCVRRCVSLLDNQLKASKVVLLDYSNPCKKLPSRYVCLEIIDYIHIYIFTLDFSHEI